MASSSVGMYRMETSYVLQLRVGPNCGLPLPKSESTPGTCTPRPMSPLDSTPPKNLEGAGGWRVRFDAPSGTGGKAKAMLDSMSWVWLARRVQAVPFWLDRIVPSEPTAIQ